MKYASKLLTAMAAMALVSQSISAVPARKRPASYRTSTGNEIILTPFGDETFHYLADANGERYFLSENELAVKASEYGLTERFRHTAPLRERKRSWSNPTYPRTGSPRVLVLLVQFSDRVFSFSTDDFIRMMNEPGYSDYGAGGSAADYFADNSCGIFTPQFDVYGPVTLSGPVADYGTNDAYGNDANAHLMVAEACRALDNEIDFRNYDEDGDGMADIVYVFYAGYGENDGGASTTVWPHTSSLSSKGVSLTLDGISINSYSCSNELQNGYGRTLTGIGTFCHEYTHVLGFPDLYATMTADRYGWTPDAWTLMDQGSYNNSSRTPAGYTAYERMSMGWLNPVEATGDALAMLPPISENRAIKVPTDASDDEYFLVEYRAKKGWDAYLPGEGILVWHIDYDPTVWNANTVNNNPDHLRVRLIPADGIWADNERPGIAFQSGTSIGLTPWIGNATASLSVRNSQTGYMGLQINAGANQLATPDALTMLEIRDTEATFAWNAVEGATGYLVTVTDAAGRFIGNKTNLTVSKPEITVSDLAPQTTYAIHISAVDGASIGTACTPLTFTTAEPGISFTQPETPEITAVTPSSFTINWQQHPGATHYLLNAWRITEGNADTDICDFTDGLSLPDGWFTTCSSTFAIASYCGASKPSLVMANHGEYLQSPVYVRDIQSLSFYYRGRNTDTTASLLIEGLIDSNWTGIETLESSTSAQTPAIDLPSGVKAIRIMLSNPNARGSLMLDDVTLGFGKSQVEDYALRDFEVTDATSYVLNNLEPESTYFVTLRAADDRDISMPSEVASVTTQKLSGLNADCGDTATHIHINGTNVTATGGEHITITDMHGRTIATGHGTLTIDMTTPGIYLVSIDNHVTKIAIHH